MTPVYLRFDSEEQAAKYLTPVLRPVNPAPVETRVEKFLTRDYIGPEGKDEDGEDEDGYDEKGNRIPEMWGPEYEAEYELEFQPETPEYRADVQAWEASNRWLAALDVVGTIYETTGRQIKGAIGMHAEMAAEGWHVNLLIAGELPEELAQFEVKPEHPSRRWAGF